MAAELAARQRLGFLLRRAQREGEGGNERRGERWTAWQPWTHMT
jgi:hypothetical protein